MTEKMHHSIQEFFKSNSFMYKILKVSYKFLPAVVFASYILFIFVSAFIYGITDFTFLKITLVPFCTFAIVSVFRQIFNAQRPYEKYNITPLIAKDKKGQSFPSRHVASGFIIAMSFLYVNMILGIIFLIISAIIAITRVLAGVHFIKDVIAGALFSVIMGYILMFLL